MWVWGSICILHRYCCVTCMGHFFRSSGVRWSASVVGTSAYLLVSDYMGSSTWCARRHPARTVGLNLILIHDVGTYVAIPLFSFMIKFLYLFASLGPSINYVTHKRAVQAFFLLLRKRSSIFLIWTGFLITLHVSNFDVGDLNMTTKK